VRLRRLTLYETERRENRYLALCGTVFYPEIDKLPIAGELVDLAFDDHAEFDAVLQEIAELPVDKPEWLERVVELKDMVRRHS